MLSFVEFAELHIHPNAVEIVACAEELRFYGELGDCILRNVVKLWRDNVANSTTVASSMRIVADEAYRHLALQMIRKLEQDQ